jgi:hypothetical protein
MWMYMRAGEKMARWYAISRLYSPAAAERVAEVRGAQNELRGELGAEDQIFDSMGTTLSTINALKYFIGL